MLERLCPALCDEVTGSKGSAGILRRIEASNSFLIALDNRREWYRYHHLFRDLLRNELLITDPDRAVDANRRAAAWLRGRGETSEAILHTIAAGDSADAVEMVAASWWPLAHAGGHQTVQGWLEALPREVHQSDARLCVASAVTAIGSGRLDEVAPWIELASKTPAAGPFYDGFSSGVAAAGCLRSVNNWLIGDLRSCRDSALSAIDRSAEPSPWDAVTCTWLGASTFWLGERDEGIDRLEAALELCRSARFPAGDGGVSARAARRLGGATAVACLGMLGLIYLIEGDLDRAQERTAAALALSNDAGLQESWFNAAAHTAHAGLLTHAGRTDDARKELDRALEVARRGSGPIEMIHALVARGMAARADGERETARAFLGEARSLLLSCPDPGAVVSSLVSKAEATCPEAIALPSRRSLWSKTSAHANSTCCGCSAVTSHSGRSAMPCSFRSTPSRHTRRASIGSSA